MGSPFCSARSAAALPPFDLMPLLAVAFPACLARRRQPPARGASFDSGWVFGFGFFLAGLYWIAAALFVDIDRLWWLVPFAAAGLPAGFAIYVGLALLATSLVADTLHLPPAARAFAFAVAWSAAEWAARPSLYRIPWNLIGYAWSGGFPGDGGCCRASRVDRDLRARLCDRARRLAAGPSRQSAARPDAGCPTLGAGDRGRCCLIVVPAAGGAVRLAATPTVADRPPCFGWSSPSIPQSLKWDPAAARDNFRRLLDLSAAPARDRLTRSCGPRRRRRSCSAATSRRARAIAAVVPKGGFLITGALRAEPAAGPDASLEQHRGARRQRRYRRPSTTRPISCRLANTCRSEIYCR